MNCSHDIYFRCSYQPMSEIEIFKMENRLLVDELVELKAEIELLEQKDRAIRNELLFKMQKNHIESFDTDSAKVIAVSDSNYNRIDSEKLKKEYPSAYHACCNSGYKDGYLLMRVK